MMEQQLQDPALADAPSPERATRTERAIAPPADVASGGPVPAPRHPSEFENALILMQSTLSILVAALFILTFIAQPYRIPSASMEDTLMVGDFLLVNKVVFGEPGPWAHLLPYRPVRRGDIAVFHFPLDKSMYLVKRVVGVPRDSIHLHHGLVYVNDHRFDDVYAIFTGNYPNAFRDEFPTQLYTDPGVNTRWWMLMRQDVRNGQLAVPAADYFVLGDNRNDSLDSRYWGFVPRANIVGEPFLVYFSVQSTGRSEITGMADDKLAHEHNWWSMLAGAARWDRTFHVIH